MKSDIDRLVDCVVLAGWVIERFPVGSWKGDGVKPEKTTRQMMRRLWRLECKANRKGVR